MSTNAVTYTKQCNKSNNSLEYSETSSVTFFFSFSLTRRREVVSLRRRMLFTGHDKKQQKDGLFSLLQPNQTLRQKEK